MPGAISGAIVDKYLRSTVHAFSDLESKLSGCFVRQADLNPLPDMPILGFTNSAANKDVMAKMGI